MSEIKQLFELGQVILSSVGVTLTIEMFLYVLYLHPQYPLILKRCCTFLSQRVSNFVSSGSHEHFFYRRILLLLSSFVSPYSYSALAALQRTLSQQSAHATNSAPPHSADEPVISIGDDKITVSINKKEIKGMDIVAAVDGMTPNLWLPSNHPIHAAARKLRSSLGESSSNATFEASSAAWVEEFSNLPKSSVSPPSNTFSLDLASSYSFGAETLTHFRFFKITFVVLLLSGLPLLYNASIIDVPFAINSNFTISSYNLGFFPQTNSRNVCYHFFAIYVFPIWCDWLGLAACYSDSLQSGCSSSSRQQRDDFWSAALTLGISPADCRPPFGTYTEQSGYCQCAPGYVGTVCRSGSPASAAYGFFFIFAASVSFIGWILMVRAREKISSGIKNRLCPQVRDYSVLIQDLPPNSHLNRNELCNFLSKKFGPIKFLSFAFDDRKLYDSKETLGACVENLEKIATSNFDYQSELIQKRILTELQVATADFKIDVNFESVQKWKFLPDPTDQPGAVRSVLRALLPHPSIGFAVAPQCIYSFIYGPNIPDNYATRCFPTVLRPTGTSSPVEHSTALPMVLDDGLSTSCSRIGVFEYMKSFVLAPSPNVIQWQALQAAISILECHGHECQNSGTAVATFEHASSKELAIRLSNKVACQARDEPAKKTSRYYVYEASFTEVDQPEDVIWRNFGVSLFEKFFRFLKSLFFCVIMIIAGSAAFAVAIQAVKCRDIDFNSKNPTVCERHGISAIENQGDIYKAASEQVGGIVLSLYTSFTQIISNVVAKKIETPSNKSQQVLFLIGRDVFISLMILYCTTVMADVAPGSPAFGYNKEWIRDNSKLYFAETITGIVTVTLSVVGPFPLRYTLNQAMGFSVAPNFKRQSQALMLSDYDIINTTQMIVKNMILCWIMAGALPLYPIVTGAFLAISYFSIKSAQVYALRPNSSCALAAPISMELFSILSPAIGIVAAVLIWFPFSNANYVVFFVACALAALLGPVFVFMLAIFFFKIPFNYQFHPIIPFFGRRGFREVLFVPAKLLLGIQNAEPIYNVCGNLAKRVFPTNETCIDNTHSIFTFWKPRLYWYELIESNPDFGFKPKQLVAMRVHKVGNEQTVDIIPTLVSGDGGAVGAVCNDHALRSISAFLPDNSKFGIAKVSYKVGPGDAVNNHGIIRLTWPSKSFVQFDTTQNAVEARLGMFPDGGIYANMPDFGQCVITLSQEELDAVARVNVERASSPHVHRCEHVLSKLLLSLAHNNDKGFRGLPIDVFFNPDDGYDSNASPLPLKFTGWPNVKRMYPSPQHGIIQDVLMPPYLPNHCDDFNPIANTGDERAALQAYADTAGTVPDFSIGPFRDDITVIQYVRAPAAAPVYVHPVRRMAHDSDNK